MPLVLITAKNGLTVMVKLVGLPGHPVELWAVTVIFAVIGVVPALTAVKDPISPVPLAGKPIDGSLLTQV